MTTSHKTKHRVGIDNYGLLPLGLSPQDVLRWASVHEAEGVAFSGLPPAQREALDEAALRDLSQLAVSLGLYLEWGGAQHIPRDTTTWAHKELAGINRRAAGEAATLGVRVVRSCSGGLMRWTSEAPDTEVLLAETASALRAQRHMLEDHGIVLAIETHFEFTSFELARLIERCEAEPGGWLGICLDTMNLLTMIEDPVCATKRLLPWIVATHIKDGGVLLTENGLTSFAAPIGNGTIALADILALLDGLDTRVNLSVEDHGGAFDIPLFDPAFLSRFPDLTAKELALLIQAAQRSAAKPECRPLHRACWAEVAESRMHANIQALRALAGHL
ncbi:MAG: sugar phosphate isomerase/epimerase family protein [Bacteroidales bacterium]